MIIITPQEKKKLQLLRPNTIEEHLMINVYYQHKLVEEEIKKQQEEEDRKWCELMTRNIEITKEEEKSY